MKNEEILCKKQQKEEKDNSDFQRLIRVCRKIFFVVPQIGNSKLVCSSTLSLSIVLSEVKQLKGRLEEWEYLDDEADRNDLENCEQDDHTHYH